MLLRVAIETTHRKIALVAGPPWWGDNWLNRAGQQMDGKDPARPRRSGEALAETRGLLDELDRLTPEVSLLLVGTSGATRLASTWADDHKRLTLRVPAGPRQTGEAEALAIEVALAMAAAGRLVRAFACVATAGDPALAALRDRGLDVRPVLPAEPAGDDDSSDGEPATTARAV